MAGNYLTPPAPHGNILDKTISSRVEREEYQIWPGQRGVATGCKPPCKALWECAPGSERDADALRFGPVIRLSSDKKEWNRDYDRLFLPKEKGAFFRPT